MSNSTKTILVTGATGYVGGRLVPELLEAGHTVRCLVREGSTLSSVWGDRVERITGDATSADDVAGAAKGAEIAFFLIHSLGGDGFAEKDRNLAEQFRRGCETAGVARIVYLGGLGDERDELSDHLASRQEVGRVLADGPTPVTELRAAIIIGSGSASFEMLRTLTEHLPVMIVPQWVDRTRCQPVGIATVLDALAEAACRTTDGHEILELGGPDVLTYREMMERFARIAGLPRRRIFGVPVLTPKLSSLWVSFVTPLPAQLATDLVMSLVNDVVVKERSAVDELGLSPIAFDDAVALSISMTEDLPMPTHWTHDDLASIPYTPQPDDPSWSGGTLLEDRRERDTTASPSDVFTVLTGIGGQRGWLWGNWMWRIRGVLDQLVGGVGLRRGRRHPDDLILGDAIDFWRVDELVIDRHLRLRAEMRTPGPAWLEWSLTAREGGGTTVIQRARYAPAGLFGRIYWYVLVPFHIALFPRLLNRICSLAESSDG